MQSHLTQKLFERPVVLAIGRIYAPIRQTQTLNRLSANQMPLHNLIHIGQRHMAIPDGFGIDDNRRPMLTLIQTARAVNAHTPLQPALGSLTVQRSG
jgi:hypothetical protein